MNHLLERRSEEAHRIRSKYPNRIPVICEKHPRSNLPTIEKKKFLVPVNMLVGEFKYIIHKHVTQASQTMGGTAEQTIYLFINDSQPRASSLISEIYETQRDDDGFLYVQYSAENSLGF